jgi:hypothetical protein
MPDTKNPGSESGSFNPSAIVVTAIAICGITLGAATLLAPAAATPGVSVSSAAGEAFAGGDTGYLPAQIANQAKEIEPMPEMYD